MLSEDCGLKVGMWLAVAECDMDYRVSDENVTFVLRGRSGDAVDVIFIREGLEGFLPLGQKALEELATQLEEDAD